ncbi:MAG: S8 family serine peptidase, partial [Chloroflexi bacterium]|nr:S8 family serine peptidase [Chloroflexota bacterium]
MARSVVPVPLPSTSRATDTRGISRARYVMRSGWRHGAWQLAIIALLSSILFFASGPSATLPRASAAQEAAVAQPPAEGNLFASGEVVVRWRSGVSAPLLQSERALVAEEIEKGAVSLLQVPVGHERETVAALSANPSVHWAHPNYVRRIQATPNDAWFPEQWGVRKIQAPLAWDFATGARSVVVAVLDTGVDLNHPDLQGRLVPGRNILNPGAPPQDGSGHGTHAAGTIAAIMNNGFGIAGVASGVSIMPIKVLEADGSGTDTHVA